MVIQSMLYATSANGLQTVVGKGGDWLAPFALRKFGLRSEETCMVGDRLDTDVAFGNAAGLRTILVLTGVCTEADVAVASDAQRPDYVVPAFAAMAGC